MIKKAIQFASLKHQNQKRKISGVPYIVHPYEVMRILMDNGCEEKVIVAGILHDILEDTQTTKEELEKEFGKEILDLVLSESENKSLTWHERKQNTINSIKYASRESKLICCADKLSNMRSLLSESKMNDNIWQFFRGNKEDSKWYYGEMIKSLSELEGLDMYTELKETYDAFFENNISLAQNPDKLNYGKY